MGKAIVQISAFRPDMNQDPRFYRPEVVRLSQDEWREVCEYCSPLTHRGFSFGLSGEMQPGARSVIQLFVEILNKMVGNSSVPDVKLKKILSIAGKGTGLKWQRSYDDNPLDEERVQVKPPVAVTDWQKQADKDCFRNPDFEDRTRKISSSSKPSPAVIPRQVIDRPDCIYRPNE